MAKNNSVKTKKDKKVETIDNIVELIKEKKPSEIISEASNNIKGNKFTKKIEEVDDLDETKNFVDLIKETDINSIEEENNETKIDKDETKSLDKIADKSDINVNKNNERPETKTRTYKDVFGYNMMGMIYD